MAKLVDGEEIIFLCESRYGRAPDPLVGARAYRRRRRGFAGRNGRGHRPGGTGESASYARFSANPDAIAPQGDGAAPCLECADSYGVAIRLRAQRLDQAGHEFRELGTVDVDAPIFADADDDYRYGGRFPDPQPVTAAIGESPQANLPMGDPSPPDMTAAPVTPVY